MKKLLLLLVFLSPASYAASPAGAQTGVDVVRAEFGLFETTATPGEVAFVPSTLVPSRVGQRYGWIIDVAKAPRTLSVREEYVLPVKGEAGSDDLSASLNVPLARRNLVSQRQLAPVDGRIVGEWSVGAREPAGHRRLEVLIEGRVAAGFEFDVE